MDYKVKLAEFLEYIDMNPYCLNEDAYLSWNIANFTDQICQKLQIDRKLVELWLIYLKDYGYIYIDKSGISLTNKARVERAEKQLLVS